MNRKRVQRLMQRDGTGGHLPAPAHQSAGSRGIGSIRTFCTGCQDRAGRPGVGGRYQCAGMTAKEVEMTLHSNYFVLLAFDLVVAIPLNLVKETRVEGDRPPASCTDDAQKS